MHDWFTTWFDSPFYHKLYSARETDEAKTFVAELITRLVVQPGDRILDSACGNAAIAKMLSEKEFDVTGVDIGDTTIAAARTMENDSLHIYLHDIRLPFWGNYFNFAINLFTRFGHYRTRREHEAAIRTIAGSLKPGGKFVIDYLNPHFIEDHPVHQEEKKQGATSYDIRRWDDALNFYKKITINDPSLQQPMEITETYAKLSLGDFTDMLSYQGMQVQTVYGDYDFSAYDVRKTPRMIIVAQKANIREQDQEKRLYSDGRKTDALT